MSRESIDYKLVIVDLERQRSLAVARFDAAIAAIKQIILINATSEVQPGLPGLQSLPLPQSASLPYRGMGMVEAAMKHMSLARHHVPNLELAAALHNGGFEHKSKNFPNTLNSVLWRRSKTVKDVCKTKAGWGMSEWKRGVSLNPKDFAPAQDESVRT
jgi:hypothetical protein